ncbi:hypothetical protein GCM10011594_22680 [Nakamurella endophytica]|uniref:PucR C-terminal helix-turn-helix domain-containing protein n=1 Tax=Nakamurella endophytica TaxID=1748367 RepID=A0A917SX37_9ACTN|nr:hypothetical protein GCM10011594_22680 [Nakamurella endophytica]
METLLRLARLPLLAAWAQSRLTSTQRTAHERASFQLLRRMAAEPPGDRGGPAGAPADDVQPPEWVEELGWRIDGANRAVWISPVDLGVPGAPPYPELTELVQALWHRHLPEWPIVEDEDGWISWDNAARRGGAPAVRKALAGLADALHSHSLVVGVGGEHRGVPGLLRSAAEARLAAHVARDGGAGSVQWFEHVGARAALALLPVAAIVQAAELCLADLIAARDRAALVETVLAVLDCGASLSQAAQRLGVHRNTVLARVARARDLGLVPDDPAQRLALHVICYALDVSWSGATPAAGSASSVTAPTGVTAAGAPPAGDGDAGPGRSSAGPASRHGRPGAGRAGRPAPGSGHRQATAEVSMP